MGERQIRDNHNHKKRENIFGGMLVTIELNPRNRSRYLFYAGLEVTLNHLSSPRDCTFIVINHLSPVIIIHTHM